MLALDKKKALLQMVDILFACCLENRIMDQDMGPESAITINRLSSTLRLQRVQLGILIIGFNY